MNNHNNGRMDLIQQLNTGLAGVADDARRSLVQIFSGQGREQGNGSGTIWHPDGLIVTNAHVVARGTLQVRLPDGQKVEARVIASDPELDIAALSVDARDLPTIEIGDSRALRPGDWVVAMGHPWGVPGGSTAGVIIGNGAALPEMPTTGREWLALSLHLRPGHSGGPLLNVNRQLVGINTMITGPNVGFAIPVHVVGRYLKKALNAVTV